jgi:hypothetical protein
MPEPADADVEDGAAPDPGLIETDAAADEAGTEPSGADAAADEMPEPTMAADLPPVASVAAEPIEPTDPTEPAADGETLAQESAETVTGLQPRRQALFLTAWLASALAVGAACGFGILAATNTSKSAANAGLAVAPSPTPSPSVTSGVRPDGTHYGSVKDFLLPIPDGYKPGPDEGGLGNDASVPPDQADPTVTLLFGALPASDMSNARGAMAAGHMSDGAVRTYVNEAGSLDIALTVLQLDPAQSAESTSQLERVVKQSRAYRTGPQVPGHTEALCVLPVTRVGDKLDAMTCLATVGDTFAIARAEGVVPLDMKAVTEMFGRQLDVLKGGLGT